MQTLGCTRAAACNALSSLEAACPFWKSAAAASAHPPKRCPADLGSLFELSRWTLTLPQSCWCAPCPDTSHVQHVSTYFYMTCNCIACYSHSQLAVAGRPVW